MFGDIRSSLTALAPNLEEATGLRSATYAALVVQAAEQRRRYRDLLEHQVAVELEKPGVSPIVAAREVLRGVGPMVPIVDEAIATSVHTRNFLFSDSSKQYSFLRGGALGWGMPAAVGCSLGLGREAVVSLVGDGAALYSPQAIWTAAHEKLPVTFVVMNNREYNVLKNFMKAQTGYRAAKLGRFIAMDIENPAVDYVALSQSMGVPARRVERAAEIASAVEAAVASSVPNLIEIVLTS